jgi:hypothetical protein
MGSNESNSFMVRKRREVDIDTAGSHGGITPSMLSSLYTGCTEYEQLSATSLIVL